MDVRRTVALVDDAVIGEARVVEASTKNPFRKTLRGHWFVKQEKVGVLVTQEVLLPENS